MFRFGLVIIVPLTWVGLLTEPVAALVSAGRVVLTSTAPGEPVSHSQFNYEGAPSIAGDGAGNLVALYRSSEVAGGTSNSDINLLRVLSDDYGATWGEAARVIPAPALDDSWIWDSSSIDTDANGTWVAAFTTTSLVLTARSTDNGATWSTPIDLTGFTGRAPVAVRHSSATDTWLIALRHEGLAGSGPDDDIGVVRSTDGGVSWSTIAALNTDAAVDGLDDANIRLATDDAGTWVAVWRRDDDILAAVSLDDGVTWQNQQTVSAGGATHAWPDIATDGNGRWLVVYSADSPPRVFASRTDDDGGSWSAPVLVNTTSSDPDRAEGIPRIATDRNGQWLLTYTSTLDTLGGAIGVKSNDSDALFTRSIDNGLTWTAPSPLHRTAKDKDGRGGVSSVVFDGSLWSIAMSDDHDFDADFGDDRDIVLMSIRDDCPPTPLTGCTTEVDPNRSRFLIKNRTGSRDKLSWKFGKGGETTKADFGDPLASDSFAMCFYDEALLAPTLKLELDLPGGGSMCRQKPCWRARQDGYTYKDGRGDNGAVKSAALIAGVAGKTKLKVKASHITLGLPNMPFDQDPAVRLQLHNVNSGNCWESIFSTSLLNTAEEFNAKSD